MDINTPDEFIEKPVIDITIEKVGRDDSMSWTINDTPEADFNDDYGVIRFFIVETGEQVRIERRNIAFSSVRRRIDRIPVKKEGARPEPPSQQPEGGMAGNNE